MLILPPNGLEMGMVVIEEVLFHVEVVIEEEKAVAGRLVGESIVSCVVSLIILWIDAIIGLIETSNVLQVQTLAEVVVCCSLTHKSL